VTYPFPERAASAFDALIKRAKFLKHQGHEETQRITVGLDTPLRGYSTNHTDELLATYGIQTAPIKLARNEHEAVTIANELGFPVVLKIASPDILHKSDVGGVLLNMKDAEFLQSGYAQLLERVKAARPEARIEGIYIQRQIPEGQEVIIGMARDPQFGALMMFGSGGVEVEGLKDVSFALAPLNQAEAQEMIRKTWAGRKLKGFRHIPAADEKAALNVLIKLSQLAMENENLAEIEINPLRVLSKGAVALDVRMKYIAPL
jgi:acetyltransferase